MFQGGALAETSCSSASNRSVPMSGFLWVAFDAISRVGLAEHAPRMATRFARRTIEACKRIRARWEQERTAGTDQPPFSSLPSAEIGELLEATPLSVPSNTGSHADVYLRSGAGSAGGCLTSV